MMILSKQNKLIKEVEADAFLKYLVPDLKKMNPILMEEFFRDFSLHRQMVVLTVINAYNTFANQWCDNFENNVTQNVFPYISKETAGAFIRAFYDRIRKCPILKGHTKEYLHETDPKKQTEDHYLIPEFTASKMIIELLILGEAGRYDNESLLLHIMRSCNVIKCTTDFNFSLKNNKDEEGLRHLDGYLNHNIILYDKDKRTKTCDSEPMIINFENLPTNKGLFITDMYYPQLKYYTNRMFVADYSELKKLGRPKIKIKKIK